MSEPSKNEFPKYVFKRGTGKASNDNGLYSAEACLVKSQEELSKLGSDWVNSPSEAAAATVGASPTNGASARNGTYTEADGDLTASATADKQHTAKKGK